ncbi:MAG: glycosyltransferase family 2 protein [Segetibacter sp.]
MEILDGEDQKPLVSCIMPTYNRREFVPHAIRYFLLQDYENKELIIIDDGTDAIRDLVPDVQNIRYYYLGQKISLGAKLNLACQHAKGKIILNWDDDDWYAARRIKYQVDALQDKGTEVCGINHLFYYDLYNDRAYQYIYPPNERSWLLGSSLCYTKELWSRNHFADINVGMDALFVWGTSSERITVLSDSTIAVHMIHKSNVSPKKTDGGWWHTYPVEEIQKIIHSDWAFYRSNGFAAAAAERSIHISDIPKPRINNQSRPLKNVYACLVHEKEDCVIDLVRNLHYHDPASIILLYNGGENSNLIQSRFPFDKFGAIVYPKPVPVKHGYLHTYALNCMQFALENFSFDSLTIVDSDQLGIRSGYSEYMASFLSNKSKVGMLSSRPERITPENKDGSVWPAVQAFKEYDLWKPFLQKIFSG